MYHFIMLFKCTSIIWRREFFSIHQLFTIQILLWKQANLANFLVKVPVKTVTFDSLDQFFDFLENDNWSIWETVAKTSYYEIFFLISYKFLRPC
jgi:hypothetical protein